MITLKDYHVHTTYSDGKNSPEEMVLSAIKMGVKEIGFSDHSYTSFDETCCIKKDKIEEYKKEILSLKEKYKDKILILLGIEQDYYSEFPSPDYDFVIGSVHYLHLGDKYICVDESVDILIDASKEFFNGDIYLLIDYYFKLEADVVNKTNADIIGHFDLIAKFNEQTPFFDANNPKYIKSWKNAIDILIKSGKPFEINTGGISRGYMKNPYPSQDIQEYIKKKGGKFILSSDSHEMKNICFAFNKF